MYEPPKDLKFLTPARSKLIEMLLRRSGITLPPAQTIARRNPSATCSLSYAQRRLWDASKRKTGEQNDVVYATAQLSGELNTRALHQALNEIIRRHDLLRSCFFLCDGSPCVSLSSVFSLDLDFVDLTSHPDQSSALSLLIDERACQAFDLSVAPLLRACLFRLDDRFHCLFICMPHIICDGWSLGIFLSEMVSLYEAFCSQLPSPLPALPIQYCDFAGWERDRLSEDILEAELDFWKQQLDGGLQPLALPADHRRSNSFSFKRATQSLLLSQALSDSIKSLSKQQAATLNMTLLAAFKALLYRYSSQTDLIVGAAVANRDRAEVEALIGPFANTVVLRTDLSGNPTFREVIARVKEVELQALSHQNIPFETLLAELKPELSLDESPLYQVMFVMQNHPMPVSETSGLKIGAVEIQGISAGCDLALSVQETGQGLKESFEYNAFLFEAATIRKMLVDFQSLLEMIAQNPDRRIDDFPGIHK